jgi:uncharacterized HAD superfamily protein
VKYINYRQMIDDVQAWSRRLPEFRAIVGVPRSGLIPAAVLALSRNVPMYSLDDVLECGMLPIREWSLRRRPTGPVHGPTLVVDDTVWDGNTISLLRDTLAHLPNFCLAAYATSGVAPLDFHCHHFGREPLLTEWTVFHCDFNRLVLTDLDGVLCEDWPHPGEDGVYEERYAHHLTNAACLIRPSCRLGGIVTSRLAKYREATEAWLVRNRITYEQLVMCPAETPTQRAAQYGFAEWKAHVYSRWLAHVPAALFIESCPRQAARIAAATHCPVLDWSNQQLLHG